MLLSNRFAAAGANQPRPVFSASTISKLPYFLTWKLYDTLPCRIRKEYDLFLASTFASWLERSTISSSADRQAIAELYLSLPLANRSRFLTAPDVGIVLMDKEGSAAANDARFFYDCVQAETLLAEKSARNSTPIWTALRDHYYPAVYRDSNIPDSSAPYGKDVLAPFHAATVEQIVIDSCSPAAMADLPGLPSEKTPYSDLEYDEAVNHLIDSLRLVKAVNPSASELIRKMLRVIIIRKEFGESKSYTSSSWPTVIGKIALTNIAAGAKDEGWIANVLLHESIHSFLYIVELHEPFYPSPEARFSHQLASPWSGRMLQLHSYVHACYVWFGLWCFWSLPSAATAFSPATAHRRKQEAAKGFYEIDLVRHLVNGRDAVVEPIVEGIRTIQEMVLDGYA